MRKKILLAASFCYCYLVSLLLRTLSRLHDDWRGGVWRRFASVLSCLVSSLSSCTLCGKMIVVGLCVSCRKDSGFSFWLDLNWSRRSDGGCRDAHCRLVKLSQGLSTTHIWILLSASNSKGWTQFCYKQGSKKDFSVVWDFDILICGMGDCCMHCSLAWNVCACDKKYASSNYNKNKRTWTYRKQWERRVTKTCLCSFFASDYNNHYVNSAWTPAGSRIVAVIYSLN